MTETQRLRKCIHETLDQLAALGNAYEPDVGGWVPEMRRACDLLLQIIDTRAADDPKFQAEVICQATSLAEGLKRRLRDAEQRWATAAPGDDAHDSDT